MGNLDSLPTAEAKGDGPPASEGRGARIVLWIAGALFALAMVALLVGSASRPEVPTFAPSPVRPQAFGDTLVGPMVYTVDAQDDTRWHFFDFSSGSAVLRPRPTNWDMAFRRHFMMVNGGSGFSGRGGIQRLDAAAGEETGEVPSSGYLDTRVASDSSVRDLEKWYDYSFVRHILEPRPGRFAVRTADGRYGVFEILSYYCDGGVGGCFTLRYMYQGDGSRRVIRREIAD